MVHLSPPITLAASNLGRQRIELMLPEPAELAHPLVDLAQWPGLDRVDAARSVRAHIGKAAVAQHLEMLRDRRLRDTELALDDDDDIARALLVARQQLQNPAANRIAENIEGGHKPSLTGTPVWAAVVRSAAALAASALVPEAIDARHHSSELRRMKSWP